MKNTALLFIFIASLVTDVAQAQAPFPTMDSMDVNNINAAVLVHGDMWWNPTLGNAHCYFPLHNQASIGFTSSLWMSGYDDAANLHIAAQTYRQNGNDYWPGPLNASDTLSYGTSHDWAKIWKVRRTEIQYFQGLATPDITNTPSSILTWPGKGNTYATGNGGVSLSITTDMAPFIDLNSNGIYEPLMGEYPDIRGEMAVWWVFSDNGPAHTETRGRPLGLEIHAMAYGYSRGTLIDNVIYYDYAITNKSANNYHNFRFGQFDDVDLGYAFDDYIGFDSSHRMGICYNGSPDDGGLAGHPLNSYGTRIPVVGLTMISLPGDTGTSYVPAGSFAYYNNTFSVIGNPSVDTQYDHYLRSKLRSGQHFTDDFVTRDTASKAYGLGPNVNCVYTSDPSDTNGWSECNCNNQSGDRRFIISSSDFTFLAGTTKHVVMALVTTAPDTLNACPGLNFDSIKIVADTAWSVYHHPPAALPVSGVESVVNPVNVDIYPNPAHDKLMIENSIIMKGGERISIFNMLGQKMSCGVSRTGKGYEAEISKLAAGMYYVSIITGNSIVTSKFVKE